MANEHHLQLLKQGKEIWNAWRQEHHQLQPDLEGADLAGMDLDHFLLWQVRLKEANLANTSLRHTSLVGTDLSSASLVDVNLHGASLVGAHLLQAYCAGVDFRGTHLHHVNFTEAELSYATFDRADLMRAIFARANAQHARFDFASLDVADLSGANLSEASFWKAQFDETQLAEANLSHAYLRGTSFNRALVQHTNFNQAILWETSFTNMDLSEARGLETVRHMARSSIDFHTWFRSQGRIAPAFLRGIGIPEPFFREMQMAAPSPRHEIAGFIAYHPANGAFAHRLFDDLQQQGIRCWLAPEYFVGGGSDHIIRQAFQPLDNIFLVLSEQEWSGAMFFARDAYEREQKSSAQLLYPLHIDRIAWEPGHARSNTSLLPDRWIGNFVEWEREETYQEAFRGLLKVLLQNNGNE